MKPTLAQTPASDSSVVRLLVVVITAVVLLLGSYVAPSGIAEARADQIDRLTRDLLDSDDHKERISAAVALARLEDPGSLDTLIAALDDEHRSVRAIVATALGKIGDRRALPALQRATRDRRSQVRRHARRAIKEIGRSSESSQRSATGRLGRADETREKRRYQVSHRTGEAGFGQDRRAVARPRVHVVVESAADESRTRVRRRVRKQRAGDMKRLFASALARSPQVTTSARLARKLGIDRYNLDASILRMTERRRGPYVEIECQIRVTISDGRGKMLSFLTGSARVQVPHSSFDKSKRHEIQHEAIENVVSSLQDDILRYLASLRRQG